MQQLSVNLRDALSVERDYLYVYVYVDVHVYLVFKSSKCFTSHSYISCLT